MITKRQVNPKARALMASSMVAIMVSSCGGDSGSTSSPSVTLPTSSLAPSPTPSPTPPSAQGLVFSDQTALFGNVAYGYKNLVGSMPEMFAGGAAVGDYDNDGDIDIFIVRGDAGPNLLFENTNGSFVDRGSFAGVAYTKSSNENYRHSGPTFADMDGDGDLDLFIGGIEGDPSQLFRNDGNGKFTNVTAGSGLDEMTSKYTISAAFGDYDLDGDVDMALSHWGTPRDGINPGDTETLWKNQSDANGLKFTSVSESSGVNRTIIRRAGTIGTALGENHDYSFTPRFADVNNDGYPDLLIAGDFTTSKVYQNNTDGTFTDVTDPQQIVDQNGMGAAVGDFDNDGDLDWFVTAIRFVETTVKNDGNRLYQNNNGTFQDITEDSGIRDGGWGWGACFADFDNDSNLDIYHTNGWALNPGTRFVNDPSKLFLSTGNGTFVDRASETGITDTQQGRGVVCADFDNDGDVDILLLHRDNVASITYWRNDLDINGFLRVTLVGKAPNSQAVGARVYVTSGGVTQMREISIGSNFTSQNSLVQNFGLKENNLIQRLRVVWPDGLETIQTDLASNQHIQIRNPKM